MSEATPGPYIIVDGTMIGSIASVPYDRDISEWYDQSQEDGPDYRFVAETATGTEEGRANARMLLAALAMPDREAIARALAQRFIDRGNARVMGSVHASWDDMPGSYRNDFYADADAILALTVGGGLGS